MAYITQEQKKAMQPAIKALLKKHNLKGSLRVNRRAVLILKVRSGKLDFLKNRNEVVAQTPGPAWHKDALTEAYMQVSRHHLETSFSGECLEFLQAAFKIINEGNWDRSDSQSDYFDVGWYSYVYIGAWDKEYVCEA
jgi:hypothetical protein